MSKNWWSVTVELLGGRGNELWPRPGRVFALGDAHTFEDLAAAIDTAFARWDRGRLSMFTLADGRIVTDPDRAQEPASPDGPVTDACDPVTMPVAGTIGAGEEFR